MIIADFECQACGGIEERIIDSSEWSGWCGVCGGNTKRIPSIGMVNMTNDDAPHIREAARTLLDRDTAIHSDQEHVRALAENPTRSNLSRYLKAEKIRYVENEKGAPPVFRKPDKIDTTQSRKAAMETLRKMRRVEISS